MSNNKKRKTFRVLGCVVGAGLAVAVCMPTIQRYIDKPPHDELIAYVGVVVFYASLIGLGVGWYLDHRSP